MLRAGAGMWGGAGAARAPGELPAQGAAPCLGKSALSKKRTKLAMLEQLLETFFPAGGWATSTAAMSAFVPPGSKQSAIVSGGRKKVHTILPDGAEMMEEFELQTDRLVVRKRRGKTVLGRELDWIYEVGLAPERSTIAHDTLAESGANPLFCRLDRIDCFEFRVRNLPYPKPTYSVTLDQADRKVVVRTSNKKYFKRITIEDMDRAGLPLLEQALSWEHEHNTLIVQYRKPAELIAAEREAAAARQKLGAIEPDAAGAGKGAGDVQCPQQ